MAELRIKGVVRSYAVGDDGRVHLGIDDAEPSRAAEFYVHDLQRNFNPSSPKFGYGAKETPCNIKPGFASYRVAVEPAEANGIGHGSFVDLVLDIYNVRNVRFYQRRWTGIPDLCYEVISVRPMSGEPRPEVKPPVSEARQDAKSDKSGVSK